MAMSSMSKLLSVASVVAILLLNQTESPQFARAGTCAGANCGPQPVQFIPGQRINVEVVNLTNSILELQQVEGTSRVAVNPGQVLSLIRGGTTEKPNFSLVLWDVQGLSLQVKILKPEARTLRVEVRPGGRPPGDRTVYLRDDGRVAVF